MTFEKVANILADYKSIDVASITAESTFADLKLDSLDVADLAMNLEDEFNVTIDLNPEVKTVGDLVKIIDEAQ